MRTQSQYHEIRRWSFLKKLRRGKNTLEKRNSPFNFTMNSFLFQVSKLYPRIQFEKMIVDNTTMQLVSNPHQVRKSHHTAQF